MARVEKYMNKTRNLKKQSSKKFLNSDLKKQCKSVAFRKSNVI